MSNDFFATSKMMQGIHARSMKRALQVERDEDNLDREDNKTERGGPVQVGPATTAAASPSLSGPKSNYGIWNAAWREGVEELRRQTRMGVPIPVSRDLRKYF